MSFKKILKTSMNVSLKYEAAQLFLKLIIRRNTTSAADQHIWMILNIEDWNNGENSAVPSQEEIAFKNILK